MDSHYRADEMELGGGLWPMSCGTGKDFDHYARDCVKLAEQPNTPSELREQLLQMAREWMQAVMDEEDGTSTSGAGLVSRTPSHCILFSTHTNTLVRASRTRLQSTDAPEMRRQLSPAPDKPPHARPQGGARARSETFPDIGRPRLACRRWLFPTRVCSLGAFSFARTSGPDCFLRSGWFPELGPPSRKRRVSLLFGGTQWTRQRLR